VLLIPVSQTIDPKVCLILFEVFCFFASLMAALLFLGFLRRKFAVSGVMTGLLVGTCMILVRAGLEVTRGGGGDDGILAWLSNLGVLEYSAFVFLVSAAFFLAFGGFPWVRRNIKHAWDVPGTATLALAVPFVTVVMRTLL
jgi:hypothetical protein